MQVVDYIKTANGGQAIDNLAASYGITRAEAQAAIEAASPMLADRIERNTLSRGGLADLLTALGDGHHAAYLGGQLPLNDPRLRADGDAILGHLLGTKDASRGLAQRAAGSSGLSSSLIRMLLPIIAGMVMGGLGKSTSGGLGDILSKMGLPGLPGGDAPSGGGASSRGGGARGGGGYDMPELPKMPGGGGFPFPGGSGGGASGGGGAPGGSSGGTSGGWPGSTNKSGFPMPGDADYPTRGGRRDGGLGGGGLGGGGLGGGGLGGGGLGGGMQSPLPLPGDIPGLPRSENNPYGDLSDILRRGGFGGGGSRPAQPSGGGGGGSGVNVPAAGGSMLWRLIRSVLGGALGFGNRGMMGWIMNFLLMRFGWPILRALLGGLFRGGR